MGSGGSSLAAGGEEEQVGSGGGGGGGGSGGSGRDVGGVRYKVGNYGLQHGGGGVDGNMSARGFQMPIPHTNNGLREVDYWCRVLVACVQKGKLGCIERVLRVIHQLQQQVHPQQVDASNGDRKKDENKMRTTTSNKKSKKDGLASDDNNGVGVGDDDDQSQEEGWSIRGEYIYNNSLLSIRNVHLVFNALSHRGVLSFKTIYETLDSDHITLLRFVTQMCTLVVCLLNGVATRIPVRDESQSDKDSLLVPFVLVLMYILMLRSQSSKVATDILSLFLRIQREVSIKRRI